MGNANTLFVGLFLFAGLFATVLSGAILFGSFYFTFEQWQLVQKGKITQGVVVDSGVEDRPSDGDYLPTKSEFIVVEFKKESGETTKFNTSPGFFKKLKEGDTLDVIYDPTHPKKEGQRYSFFELFGLPILILLFIGPFFLFSLYMLRSMIRSFNLLHQKSPTNTHRAARLPPQEDYQIRNIDTHRDRQGPKS